MNRFFYPDPVVQTKYGIRQLFCWHSEKALYYPDIRHCNSTWGGTSVIDMFNLSYDGGGALCAPPILYLFFYSKSLPQTKPLDPPVNS